MIFRTKNEQGLLNGLGLFNLLSREERISRRKPLEAIVSNLREVDLALAKGGAAGQVCRCLG